MIGKRIWIIELENIDNDVFVFIVDVTVFNRLSNCVPCLALVNLSIYVYIYIY